MGRLVESAAGADDGGDDRALRDAVNGVMKAFDPDDAKAAKDALRQLDRGAAKARGRGAQVLHLALGALVEAGAPPEVAWPAVRRGLRETLEGATRFAQACVKASGEELVDEAIAAAGKKAAAKKPADADAWQALASRCLAAVACLTRSRKLRSKEQGSGELAEAVYPLEAAVEEVSFLSQVLAILDDARITVLHPESERGFEVTVRDVSSNLELFVLLTNAIVGDPKKGLIEGQRPDRRAVAALTDPGAAPKKPPAIVAAFNLVAWTGLAADGTLPEADPEDPAHWIWLEGVPADIPAFEGRRVILLQDPADARALAVEASFAALSPEVRVVSKIAPAAVSRMLAKMGKAASAGKSGRKRARAKA
ncbi:MAG: hypothetical protein KF819_00965 [Labilithrix sp.]|nr:hypothetical protein [Labilithrix sp.]